MCGTDSKYLLNPWYSRITYFCQGITTFSLQTSGMVLQLVRWIIWFVVFTFFFFFKVEEEEGEGEKSIL